MNNGSWSGFISSDIELKQTPEGISVCRFSVAVRRPNTKDKTDFLAFVAWRQKAEFVSRYFKKGQWIEISGTLTTRKWEDTHNQKRVSYEIVCEDISFGGVKRDDAKQVEPDFSEINAEGDEKLPF